MPPRDVVHGPQAATAKALFDSHDVDKSGTLDEHEVGMLIDEMASRESGQAKNRKDKQNKRARRRDKAQAFRDMDADKGGHVSLGEFLAWWNHDASHGIYEQKARALFDKADADGSGCGPAAVLTMAVIAMAVIASAEV